MSKFNLSNILPLLIFLGITSTTYAFETLLFQPFTANHLEGRIGTFFQPENDKLRLDIGTSLDLLHIYSDSNITARLGGDFFILSRLRSEGHFKFPVETADYYFGLNASATTSCNVSARLRVAHISSHLIDGYTDNYEFIQPLFVYSREFVDLAIAYNTKYVRPYIGVTAIFSTIPKDVNTFVPQLGFDFNYPIISPISIAGGYDLKVVGGDNMANVVSNSLQLGVELSLSPTTALSLNYYYYNGYSIHGMFYNQKESYNGFGIQFVRK
ncbi:MAG: DUF1207 domain-containing protein [Ignavibacteria bacterium]|jgi:hypothetical protein|nr:DUF1207 domain-containing protein [Ignavibacteria bacterium]